MTLFRPLPLAAAALLAFGGAALCLPAQTPPTPQNAVAPPPPAEVSLVLTQETGRRIPLAIPQALAPAAAPAAAQVAYTVSRVLTDDLASLPTFVVTDAALYPAGFRPPQTREGGDAWVATGAQFLLDSKVDPAGDQVVVTVTLHDLRTLKPILVRKYQGVLRSARTMAHFAANDVVRQFTGQPGPFLAKIAFVSDRDGGRAKEIYLMDWDGENQRRITWDRSLSLAPSFSPDGTRIVFQSYSKGRPELYVIPRDGGVKSAIRTTVDLNASPAWGPDGKSIAFCGAVRGNPEIFSVAPDGTQLRRLTDSPAIDSSPSFSPNGRELLFTSNRQGKPQIFLMDGEGTNVRRLTFAGSYSDEAVFSPRGGQVAFACKADGDFQICVLDVASGRTFQITSGRGANENPAFSPDGTKIAWQRQTGSSTQIVLANANGSGIRTLTTLGNNTSPAFTKNLD